MADPRHLHLQSPPPRVESNRRDILRLTGAAVACSAAIVAGGIASASPLPSNATPFRIAEAAYLAADAHFAALPPTLEDWDADAYREETRRYIAALNALEHAPIADLREFADAFRYACDDGETLPGETFLSKLVADAKRLTGAA